MRQEEVPLPRGPGHCSSVAGSITSKSCDGQTVHPKPPVSAFAFAPHPLPLTMAATTATSRPQASRAKDPTTGGYDYSVGTAIPANMPHAVSVSLPRWQDNVDYEEGRLTEVMEIGYPRFFINKSIQKVCIPYWGEISGPRQLTDFPPRSPARCSVAQEVRHARHPGSGA